MTKKEELRLLIEHEKAIDATGKWNNLLEEAILNLSRIKDTAKKEELCHFAERAKTLDAIGEWNESVEESYWKIKEDLFKAETLWEYEKPYFYWKEEVKDAVFAIQMLLDKVWRRQ